MRNSLSIPSLLLILISLLVASCGGGAASDATPLSVEARAVRLTHIVSLAAGEQHACALGADGAVLCWGNDFSGQLDDGTTANAFAPVAAPAWSHDVTALAAGMTFSCALVAGGTQCVGGNEHGQLGNGTDINSLRAVTVAGLGSGVTALAAGEHFLCGLVAGGGVRCLGDNQYGQLGDGTTTDADAAQAVSGLTGVTAIAAGDDLTCALIKDGTVRCWGNNAYGQLGSGATTLNLQPTTVFGLNSGVAAVSPGQDFTCVLTSAGGAACIGDNPYGQLGSGSPQLGSLPYGVKNLASGVSTLAAGNDFACALTIAGAVQCWGNNTVGQLGNGTTTAALAPAEVSGLGSSVIALAAGVDFACAANSGGAVQCWGDNAAGQLGNDVVGYSLKPVPVSGVRDAVAIAAGADFACALSAAGTVSCWGDNSHGQLGDGSTVSANRAVAVHGIGTVTALSAGYGHACALDSIGQPWCWGQNARGQLGDGGRNDSEVPVAVSGLTGTIMAIAAGRLSTCALNAAGAVQCWGDGAFGELGNGTTGGSLQPVTVLGLGGNATAIGASRGRDAFCAVVGGALRCWGDQAIYVLYANTPNLSDVPVEITGLDQGVTALALGAHHACIINGEGGVQCWGNDGHGELGDGTIAPGAVDGAAPAYTALAMSVVGLSDAHAVTAGRDFSCALTAAGEVHCWGRNDHGQLGDGTLADSAVPVAVRGLGAVAAVVAGGDFACALTIQSQVLCWGNNDVGQLGTRTADSYPQATVPVPVL